MRGIPIEKPITVAETVSGQSFFSLYGIGIKTSEVK